MKTREALEAELASLLLEARPSKAPAGSEYAVTIAGTRPESLDTLVGGVLWTFHHGDGTDAVTPRLARVAILAAVLGKPEIFARLAEATKRQSRRHYGWGDSYRVGAEKPGVEALRQMAETALRASSTKAISLDDLRRIYLAAEAQNLSDTKGTPSVSDRTLLRLAAEFGIPVLRGKPGRPTKKIAKK